MKKIVEVISEDDDFFDAILKLVDIDNRLKVMHFLDGTIKQIRMIIIYKNHSYTQIDQLVYFCKTDNILQRVMEKIVVRNLLEVFHENFYGGHFVQWVTVE